MNPVRVDSFHVSVDAGDAAIHIYSNEPDQTGKRKVISAVMVDGGKCEDGEVRVNIWQTIIQIEDEFSCPGPQYTLNGRTRRKLLFDSLVITHFDADHCNGVLRYIEEDYDATSGKISRCKYNGNVPNTWIFAPHWDKKYSWTSLFKRPSARLMSHLVVNFTDNQNSTGWLQYKEGPTSNPISVLKIAIGTAQVLGRNFFNPDQLPPSNKASINSISDMVNANKPPDSTDQFPRPGLYCVGINQAIFGPNGFSALYNHTETNMSSICAMVVWSNYNCSHYFAGDADIDFERRLAQWVGTTVTSMKLSHHGAVHSTPKEMLHTFDASNVIISSGGGSYGHPRWEMIAMIHEWSRSRKTGKQPLFITKWPTWLVKDKNGKYNTGSKWAMKELSSTTTTYLDTSLGWLAARKAQVRQARGAARILSMVERYKEAVKSRFGGSEPTAAQKKTWICEEIEMMMEELGLEDDSTVNAQGSHTTNKKADMLGLGGAIMYIRVRSSLDSLEGDVEVRKVDQTGSDEWFANHQARLVSLQSLAESNNIKYDMNPNPKDKSGTASYVMSNLNRIGTDFVGLRDLTVSFINKASTRRDSWHSLVDISDVEDDSADTWAYLINEDHDHAIMAFSTPSMADGRPWEMTISESGSLLLEPDVKHPISGFIQALHYPLLALEKPASGTSGVQVIPFSADDEWQGWLRTIANTGTESSKPQLAITTDLPITSTTSMEFSFTHMFDDQTLVMETREAKTVFESHGVSNTGLESMLKSQMTMVFALKKPTSFTTTFAKVAAWASFNHRITKVPDWLQLKLDLASISPSGTDQKPIRNAMWFTPNESYETVTRLQFKVSGSNFVFDYLKDVVKDFKLKETSVIAKRIVKCRLGAEEDTAELAGRIALVFVFDIMNISLVGVIEFRKTSLILSLQNHSKDFSISSLIQWLAKSLGGNSGAELQGHVDKITSENVVDKSKIFPRRINLELAVDSATGKPTAVTDVSITLETYFMVGKSPDQLVTDASPVVFKFVLGWTQVRGPFLNGSLWCPSPKLPTDEYCKALPYWEEHEDMDSIIDPNNTRGIGLDLRTLFSGGIENIPRSIPTQVVLAEASIDAKSISFAGLIRCADAQDSGSKVPQVRLEEVDLALSYSWDKANRGLVCNLDVEVILFNGGTPSETDELDQPDPVRLLGAVQYNGEKKTWSLNARVQDLNVGYIASFWRKDTRDNVMELLGKLSIDYLDLQYDYDKGVGSKFVFDGVMSLGDPKEARLELNVTFEHSPESWSFQAKLGARSDKDEKVTIGKLLKSIVGETVDLPSAINDITIGGCEGKDLFRLLCTSVSGYTVSRVTIQIGDIAFAFMQIMKKEWKKAKRIIKVAVTEIPGVTVPMFGKIDQPFDQLFYLWVQDKSEGPGATGSGLTKEEFDMMALIPDIEPSETLYYKKTKDPGANEIVLIAGHHLVVVMKKKGAASEVLIDYIFAKQDQPVSKQDELVRYAAEESPKASSKAPLKKTIGPLSVDSIGLWYKDGKIGITFDATFLMGPIGIALLGFSIGAKFKNFSSLPEDPSFSLDGLIVAFDKKPLTIAGGFMRSQEEGRTMYAGGLIIGFTPWMFEAMGVYATIPRGSTKAVSYHHGENLMLGDGSETELMSQDYRDDTLIERYYDAQDLVSEENTFTMVFIICKLNGPLFSIGWAEISGLTGGVGVNTDITMPTIDQVVDYPFVKSGGTGGPEDSPVTQIKNLMKGVYFRPAEGSYWVAAGFKVIAFQMLSVDTVIILQFLPDVKLAIVGLATMDIPTSKADIKFAYVELGILCVLDPGAGIFKLEAQLTSRSFVLHKSCHLTGGMALFQWFKSNVQNDIIAGDWVLSIGGYHQAFRVPKHYPKPPRLGISWKWSDKISILGEAYFAVTPKACMAGGRLHASYTSGRLYAYFDAYMDVLINYEPFFFMFEAGIAVGVRYTLNLLITTKRISVEISAMLYIEGPDVGGRAKVNFWVFGFTITFGAQPRKPPALNLADFWKLAIKQKSTAQSTALLPSGRRETIAAEVDKPCLINCESGLVSDGEGKKETKEGEDWLVRAGQFAFTVSYQFPINGADFRQLRQKEGNEPPEEVINQPLKVDHGEIFARPMEVQLSLDSTTSVEVTLLRAATLQRVLPDIHLYDMTPRPWQITMIAAPLPKSLWAKYDSSVDPSVNRKSDELLDGSKTTTMQTTGMSIRPPEPYMSQDKIPKFNLVKDMQETVFKDSKARPFPPKQATNEAWRPRIGDQPFKDVQKLWLDMPDDTSKKVAQLWSKRLKFKVPVEGNKPRHLVENLHRLIPASPLIAVGM